jgi:hypothetical protein
MRPSRETDGLLLSSAWGAVWGGTLGSWLVAPALFASHRLHAQSVLDATVLVLVTTILLAILGAVLGIFGGFIPVAIETHAEGFRNRAWAYGLFLGPITVLAYVGDAILTHSISFRSAWSGATAYLDDLMVVLPAVAVGSIVLIALYRLAIVRRRQRVSWLIATLCAVALAGMIASGGILRSQPSAAFVKLRSSGSVSKAPLLFIGVDGATWRLLQPAIRNGEAPTLARLVEAGVNGTIEAQWPPYWSSAAWASIVTGLPREITGVYEDLAAQAPGLSPFQVPLTPTLSLMPFFSVRTVLRETHLIRFTPPPRAVLNGTPIWQLLHDRGVSAAVVRFRFTYPPDGQADIVISDWTGHDEWDGLGVRHSTGPETVSPRGQAETLLAPFRSSAPFDPGLLNRLLPGATPPTPETDYYDPVNALFTASDIDARTFAASRAIVREHPRQPFLAVYIGGLDGVEHAFWPYRFPQDFSTDIPSAKEVQRLGPVIDRYVHYVDSQLADLLSQYAAPPNVVIVSDHGHGATTLEGRWRGWHTKDGIFVASGPDVRRRSQPVRVSYYDVVPTLASLAGFSVSGVSGRASIEQE